MVGVAGLSGLNDCCAEVTDLGAKPVNAVNPFLLLFARDALLGAEKASVLAGGGGRGGRELLEDFCRPGGGG